MITAQLSPTAFVENKNCATNNFGLGNKLFKIAAAISLAKKNNSKAVFPDLAHSNHKYFKETIFRKLDDNNGDSSFITNNFTWYRSGYVEIPFREGLNLKGDFQSWRFFKNMNDEIKDVFSIPSSIKDEIMQSEYSHVLAKKTVGLHIRRGDYVDNKDQYNVIDVDYIDKALSYFNLDHTCVVFSDDIPWCKKNVKSDHKIVFVENKSEIFDVYLMTLLDNVITSNSTFSWWGAYLNANKDKLVITPRHWYNEKLKKQGYHADSDLLPNNWVKL